MISSSPPPAHPPSHKKKLSPLQTQVSLTGRVLPVGGVKEKVLAARRAGVRRVALPEANRRDWDELAADVREGIDASFHEDYGSVFEVAFGAREEGK